MSENQIESSQPDNPHFPPLESAGRSIADDLLIETLIAASREGNTTPLAKAMVKKLVDGSDSSFDKYLEALWGARGIRLYDNNPTRHEYNARLNYIKKALSVAPKS